MPQTPNKQGNRWGSNKRLIQQDEGRRAIIDAAVSCFEKKGVNSTTIDEIAKAANITRRTVYHYFKSKSDILEAAVEQHACDVINRMTNEVHSEQPFTDYIVECLVYMIEQMPKEAFYKLQVSEQAGLQASYFYFTSHDLRQVWLDAFQQPYIEALRQRTINPELELQEILAWVGRIVLSYLQYPNPKATNKSLKMEMENFFANALKYGA